MIKLIPITWSLLLFSAGFLAGQGLLMDELDMPVGPHSTLWVPLDEDQVASSAEELASNQYELNFQIDTSGHKHWFHTVSLSYLRGSLGDGLAVEYTLLYNLDKFSIGAGSGISNYLGEDGNNIIPLFLEGIIDLKGGKTRPFIGVKSGYGFLVPGDTGEFVSTEDGWLFAARFGVRFVKEKSTINFFLGYRRQGASYIYRQGSTEVTDEYTFKRTEFGAAIGF